MSERVAIVHDWLNGMRGGEKVLLDILQIFPQAHIYTLFYEPEKIDPEINKHQIFPSKLNQNLLIRKNYSYFLSRFPETVESFNLQNYDLIISSSHCVAKGIIPPPDGVHICYLHSPMRYAWDQYFSYFQHFPRFLQYYINRRLSLIRLWDVTSAQRVDHFIANSRFVRERIARYYRREAEVIHPPVDTDFFSPGEGPKADFFLTVAALVPYKRTELIIRAFNQLKFPLIVVGNGPERRKLKKIAEKNIQFRNTLSREELRELYRQAKALIFAGVEDFGISFVESTSCGTPLIAYGRGGVLDILQESVNGISFAEQSTQAIVEAVRRFLKMNFDPQKVQQSSRRFSRQRFREQFAAFIKDKLR